MQQQQQVSSPRMSGLSSMRMSPLITVLSRVRITCSRKSWPKCFSTQAYCKENTHTAAQRWSEDITPPDVTGCSVDPESAYLLIWAVFVMFDWAGANKDICAVERTSTYTTITQWLKLHVLSPCWAFSDDSVFHYVTQEDNVVSSLLPSTFIHELTARLWNTPANCMFITYLSILAIALTASTPPGRGSSSMKKSLDSQILIALSWGRDMHTYMQPIISRIHWTAAWVYPCWWLDVTFSA